MTRLAPATLLLIALAGCGGAAKHHTTAPRCPAMLPAARASVAPESAPGLLICTYATSSDRLQITFDDGPQAWFRYTRAQVERTQTTVEWAKTPDQQPKDVGHVGAGAFWVPATRELVTSDGRRLLTIRVVAPRRQTVARKLAIRIAPHGLGPNRVPVKTGP